MGIEWPARIAVRAFSRLGWYWDTLEYGPLSGRSKTVGGFVGSDYTLGGFSQTPANFRPGLFQPCVKGRADEIVERRVKVGAVKDLSCRHLNTFPPADLA